MEDNSEPDSLPIDFGVIRDPDTGREDATFEVWHLRDSLPHELEAMSQIQKSKEAILISTDDEEISRANSLAKISALGLIDTLVLAPPSAQFIVAGRLGIFAVRVSYNDPYEMPPERHPVINQAMEHHAGDGGYATLKLRRYKSSK